MARSLIGSARSVATNRVNTQPMNCSLRMTANTSNCQNGTAVTNFDSAFTISILYKTGNDVSSTQRIFGLSSVISGKTAGLSIGSLTTAKTIRGGYYNGSSYVAPKSKTGIIPNTWYDLALTWDGSTVLLYVNGIASGTTGNNPNVNQYAGVHIGDASGSSGMNGGASLKNARVWTRCLSATEILKLYTTGQYDATSLWSEWKLNEGAGTTAYDTSGNGNNGTITAGTYTLDTPSKKRPLVNGNMVYNGDFEFAPPTNVAFDSSFNWLDGTNTGSASNSLFGWYANASANQSIMFKSGSGHSGSYALEMKNTAGYNTIIYSNSKGYTVAGGIPIIPSTSYTLSFWYNITSATGTSADGVELAWYSNKADGTIVNTANLLQTTNTTAGWTFFSATITPPATARTIQIVPRILGGASFAATAYFDDITLNLTTPQTRTAA
jgi:hypothetical protein